GDVAVPGHVEVRVVGEGGIQQTDRGLAGRDLEPGAVADGGEQVRERGGVGVPVPPAVVPQSRDGERGFRRRQGERERHGRDPGHRSLSPSDGSSPCTTAYTRLRGSPRRRETSRAAWLGRVPWSIKARASASAATRSAASPGAGRGA